MYICISVFYACVSQELSYSWKTERVHPLEAPTSDIMSSLRPPLVTAGCSRDDAAVRRASRTQYSVHFMHDAVPRQTMRMSNAGSHLV